MSTKRKQLLPGITTIVASSGIGTVGTFDIPVGDGFRLHNIQLVYIDGTGAPTDILAMFDDITVLRNGVVQRLHTGAELERLNTLNGSQFARQQVNTVANMRQTQTIFMAEPFRKDKVDTDVLAWNVCAENGWKTLQVKIKLLAAMPATGSIIAYAWQEPMPNNLRGVAQSIKKVYRQQIGVAGLSTDVTTLDARDAYQVIALKQPSGAGAISSVTLKRNTEVLLDQVIREDNVAALVGQNLNPANSVAANAFGFEIVLDADDPINSAAYAQGAAMWMQLKFSAAAGGNVVACIERFGPFD